MNDRVVRHAAYLKCGASMRVEETPKGAPVVIFHARGVTDEVVIPKKLIPQFTTLLREAASVLKEKFQ